MHFSIINHPEAELDAMLQEAEDRVDHNQFYQFQNSLTQGEIDKIITENQPSTHRATTFSGSSDSIRKSDINWIEKEKNGIDNYPLYQWTKDSLARKDKIEKYHNSYTVYINSEEVYSENLANNIENDLLELVDKETVLRISKHDTNPKNNPQPPSKYQ